MGSRRGRYRLEIPVTESGPLRGTTPSRSPRPADLAPHAALLRWPGVAGTASVIGSGSDRFGGRPSRPLPRKPRSLADQGVAIRAGRCPGATSAMVANGERHRAPSRRSSGAGRPGGSEPVPVGDDPATSGGEGGVLGPAQPGSGSSQVRPASRRSAGGMSRNRESRASRPQSSFSIASSGGRSDRPKRPQRARTPRPRRARRWGSGERTGRGRAGAGSGLRSKVDSPGTAGVRARR